MRGYFHTLNTVLSLRYLMKLRTMLVKKIWVKQNIKNAGLVLFDSSKRRRMFVLLLVSQSVRMFVLFHFKNASRNMNFVGWVNLLKVFELLKILNIFLVNVYFS